MKIITSLKRNLGLTLIYLILIVVFYRWFLPGSFLNGDTWLLQNQNISYTNAPFLWKGFHDLGVYYVDTPFLIINFIASLPTMLFGLEFNSFSIKVLFFYPYLILAPLGSYLLTKKLTKSDIGSLISALVYTINTPNMIGFAMGHINTVTAYAFLPLILHYTISFFEDRANVRNVTLVNTLFLVCAVYDIRIAYLSFLCFCILLLYKVSFQGLNHLRGAFLLFGTVSATILVSNLFWIIPSLFSANSLQSNPILNRPVFGGQFLNILYPLAFFHPYWTPKEIAIFTTQKIPIIFYGIPVLSIMGLCLNRKDKYILFFLILLIIGVILTKQYNPPFSIVYKALFDHLPGFKLFREPTKFYYIVGLAYSVIVGFVVSFLARRKLKVLLILAILSLIFLTYFIAKPVFTGEAKTLFVPVQTYDISYQRLNALLTQENKGKYFRILWIPTASSLSVIKDTMPHLHLELIQSSWKNILEAMYQTEFKEVLDLLNLPEMDEILDLYSVRYIVLPKKHTVIEDDFFYWYGKRETFQDRLDKITYLKKINLEDKEIDLYENTEYYPHLFTTQNILQLGEKTEFKEVKYDFISPVEYRTELMLSNKKTYINITDSYHPDWGLYIGNFHWTDIFIPQNNTLDDKYHIKNEIGLSSFLLDPSYIKTHIDPKNYTLEKDGSVNLKITLYFRPQAYMYLGMLISGVFLASVEASLLYYFFLKQRQRLDR